MRTWAPPIGLLLAVFCGVAAGADQTIVGTGNAAAESVASHSARVRAAHDFLVARAHEIGHRRLREMTLELLQNRDFCVTSRAGVGASVQARMIGDMIAAGLVDAADDAAFPGGLIAGVFPPLRGTESACPHLPMAFDAAPGSAFGAHHGYPGGLPVHEANNLRAALALLAGYRASYGASLAVGVRSEFFIDRDVLIAAPIWHDWAKTLVFQWTAEGREFMELNLGGTPENGSATGAHHIISIAESMKRGLPPVFVIAQACAHSSPTLGNESKVVHWIRAAAILAQVDPFAAGYLMRDTSGDHLPAVRRLAGGFDLVGAGQSNLLPEYTLHNLSDGDFTFSIPAAVDASRLIERLAPRYGVNPADVASYNTRYRNPVFARLGQERLLIVYANGGLPAVQAELDALRAHAGF